MSIPSKQELIEGWEYILTHHKGSLSALDELIQTSVNVLKGNPDPNKQKAIDTWTRILVKEKPGEHFAKLIDATLYYMTRSTPQ